MPRCKNCRQKFEPIRFNQKYCFNEECVKAWVDYEKTKQWKAKKTQLKKEMMSLQDYLKIAQQVFNKYIRERDKGLPCISCGKQPKKANAGHYFSQGGHSNVRFHEDNVHLQCEHCNSYLSGNLLNYQIGIEKRIGTGRLIVLELIAHDTKKWTIEELKELIATYKDKIKLLS